MLEGSGKALGFSPTTGGGKFCDLLAQPLTISSGSSKASNTAFLLFSMGIGNLLLVTGVDFTLAEGFAGVIQGSLHPVLVFLGAGFALGRQRAACPLYVQLCRVELRPENHSQPQEGHGQRLESVGFELVEHHAPPSPAWAKVELGAATRSAQRSKGTLPRRASAHPTMNVGLLRLM